MQFTFELGEITGPPEELASVDNLMTRYSSAKRIAFNSLLRKLTMKEVVHGLEAADMIAMNWRYCEHAARDADAELKSQRALLSLYLEEAVNKIETLNQMLAKAKAPKKVEWLLMMLARLEKRRAILKRHLDDGTLPKVIFGTRELFVKRTKGKISNEEWKEARDSQLYSIGQANQAGNANARIDWNEKKIGINFPRKIWPRQAKDRTFHVKNERRWLELKMNGKFERYADSLRASGRAYSVRVMKRGNNRYFVHVSFEISLLPSNNPSKRVCSVDSNPVGFAAAIVSRDGNLLAHRFFRDDRLVYASEKKRDATIGNIVSKIVAWAREQRAEAFAIEDLNIRGSRSFGKRVNRIVYTFVRRKFSENLLMRCWKDGLSASLVNPAYTSKIGDAKYRAMYGLSVHEVAAFCIGRRFFGYGEKFSLSITMKAAKVKRKVPVNYVWASIYSYQRAADRRMEPPRRKGSAGENLKAGNEAVFTGRPVFERTPLTERGEEARKDGEPGGSPGATGNGVKPAPQGGKVAAASSDDIC